MPSKHRFLTDTEWEELICQCRSSGLSDWQWCRENGISTSSFYRHLKKFRNAVIIPHPDGTAVGSTGEPVQEVVPLLIRDEPSIPAHIHDETVRKDDAPAVRLTIRGISFDIYNHAGSELISSILHAVEGLC